MHATRERGRRPGSRGAERLRARRDFAAVMRDGQRARHQLLHAAVRPNGLPLNRYGYAVGKRVGGAVIRNRTKRRLREVIRALPLAPGHDVLIVAHPAAADAPFSDLSAAVRSVLRRAGVLQTAPATGQGVRRPSDAPRAESQRTYVRGFGRGHAGAPLS